MGHIGDILGIIILVIFLRWNRRHDLKLFHIIVEVIVFGILLYIGNSLRHYFDNHIHISIPILNRIPEEVSKWFWFTLFFIGCCTLSIKSWIQFNKRKRDEKSDTY